MKKQRNKETDGNEINISPGQDNNDKLRIKKLVNPLECISNYTYYVALDRII